MCTAKESTSANLTSDNESQDWNLLTMIAGSITRRCAASSLTMSRVLAIGVLVLCFGCQLVPVDGKYDCKENTPANCSCSRDINGNYDLLCPFSKPAIMLQIESNSETNVKLQCDSNIPDDFKIISGANIGETGILSIKFCSIPNAPFKSLMKSMGIPKIQKLEISYSAFDETISRKHFEGLSDIDTLRLDESNLTVIPDDLFQDVTNVSWLNIRGNFITDLPKDVFRSLTKLQVLELGNNKLKNLEPGVFNNLTRLRLLNLWSNQLTDISRAVFTSTPNLESLDLSHNSLVSLRTDIFADLSKLETINLSGNEFSTLPQNLFLDNLKLKMFTMVNQRTLKTIPSQLLANLEYLQFVQISRSQISSLPKDVFWNSTSIASIMLNENQLTELPVELFRDNGEVKKIDISSNQITSLPDELFKYNKKLTGLKASRNKLKFLSADLLEGLYDLNVIDMSFNRIEEIHPNAFQRKPKLEVIDFTNNFLTFETSQQGAQSPFQYCKELKTLKLANNSIGTFFEDWHFILTRLQYLDLSYNKISIIQAEDLQFNLIQEILKVDLSHNNISRFDMSGLELIAKHQCDLTSGHPNEKIFAKIILAGNPLDCDCKIYDFLRFVERRMIDEAYCHLEIDTHGLLCAGPGTLKDKEVTTISSRAVTCDVHHLHDLVSMDDRASCPHRCQCSYRQADSALLVDCMDLGLVHLDHAFMLPTYNIYTHFSRINHTILYLNRNELQSLPQHLDKGFMKVTHLYLASNNLSYINITQLSPNITVLDLTNNNLTHLDDDSIAFLEQAQKLERLSLQNNPWTCDCSARSMLTFAQENFKKVEMLSNITCAGGGHLLQLSLEELCPIPTTGIIVFSVVIAVLGIVIGVLAALYYRYQLEIKVWLYAHQMCLWFVTEEDLDKDKIYDAFVSYSHHDEDFVIKQLVRKLEEGPKNYKLCLHYRDWIVGDWIPNQIARSVEDSKRTIVVLSPNFLDSVWSKMEFRTAHKGALKEKRAKVILILYKDIGPTENLDPELKAYMSMNTYLRWDDPWFWDKLYYALPHPLQFSNRIPMLSRSRPQQTPSKPILDLDKTDLIKGGSDPNASPPATTTPPAETFLNAQPSLIPNGTANAKLQVKV
ncbi:protein toll [Nilaparvata lugens]|uniref:protein toll n=1 Tax=Nilaparvata lugens TaxID=108931 RepID=UPI00193C907D|nr:protein toll [Nilaparvata lugens]